MFNPVHTIFRIIGLKCQGDLGPITCYTDRHNRVVWYPKAPPKEPPTDLQLTRRARFTLAGQLWNELTIEQREEWTLAARRAHLRISGYNLFTYLITSHRYDVIKTIEFQSDIQLTYPIF
jgi:hypothetical protein